MSMLMIYEPESFWDKLKNKIRNFFFKKKKIAKEPNRQEPNQIKPEEAIAPLDKIEFFSLYEQVKKQEVPIETLDKETIRRILIMLEEELKINEKKMEEKMQTLEISLDNIQIYQKEIELMKKTES